MKSGSAAVSTDEGFLQSWGLGVWLRVFFGLGGGVSLFGGQGCRCATNNVKAPRSTTLNPKPNVIRRSSEH